MAKEDVAALEQKLQQLRVEATRQNEAARALRQQQAPAGEIEAAAVALGATRAKLNELEQQIKQTKGYEAPSFVKYRQQCENLIKRRFFVVPAFEIYGGVGGLYDFGPPGTFFLQLSANPKP